MRGRNPYPHYEVSYNVKWRPLDFAFSYAVILAHIVSSFEGVKKGLIFLVHLSCLKHSIIVVGGARCHFSWGLVTYRFQPNYFMSNQLQSRKFVTQID